MSLPTVYVEGGLVADPELAFSGAGKPWARFRVATNDRTRDATGGWTDGPATFVNVVCFGRLAENVCESMVQGDRVVVWGRLEQHEFTTREGENRTAFRIVAEDVAVSLRFRPARTERVVTTAAAPAVDPWA